MADEETRGTCIACKHAAGRGYEIECRVSAPAVDYKNHYRRFPIMREDDWCSRFKPREGADT